MNLLRVGGMGAKTGRNARENASRVFQHEVLYHENQNDKSGPNKRFSFLRIGLDFIDRTSVY